MMDRCDRLSARSTPRVKPPNVSGSTKTGDNELVQRIFTLKPFLMEMSLWSSLKPLSKSITRRRVHTLASISICFLHTLDKVFYMAVRCGVFRIMSPGIDPENIISDILHRNQGPGRPGKLRTNFPVLENTWEMRENVKCLEKSCVAL